MLEPKSGLGEISGIAPGISHTEGSATRVAVLSHYSMIYITLIEVLATLTDHGRESSGTATMKYP